MLKAKSLAQSRWATTSQPTYTNTATTTTTNRSKSASPAKANPSSAQELARFMKIVSRLKWKLPFLSAGYRTATGVFGLSPADVANAEIMFKIDFHEYYSLLERAIVHLLAVFGIEVYNSRSAGNQHRYHANVLEALERKSCPLYPFLGSGPVREQLRRAKQLRNQWKTADSPEEDEQQQRPACSLESYDLDAILMGIFGGLEQGHALAEEYISKDNDEMETDTATEADWDFIVDAMDWEAV